MSRAKKIARKLRRDALARAPAKVSLGGETAAQRRKREAHAEALTAAGVQSDSRTAAGRRQFRLRDVGGKMKAQRIAAEDAFWTPGEALVGDRRSTCDRFVLLYGAAHKGLIKPPSVEMAVDGSPPSGRRKGNPDLVLYGHLEARLGRVKTMVLVERLVNSQPFDAIASLINADCTPFFAGRLFGSAVDEVGRLLRET